MSLHSTPQSRHRAEPHATAQWMHPSPRPMAPPVRLLGALGLALAAAALGAPSCGTDAVGVDACRRIEAKRCEVAPTCSADYKDVDACNDYFRDQCLHGIENADRSPSDADVKACIDAIAKAADCAKAGAKTLEACATHPLLVDNPSAATLTPCEAITKFPDLLAACAFVAKPVVDAGVLPDAPSEASDGAGGGGGASSSASTAASSSASSAASSSSSSSSGAGGGGGAGGA